jgi:hypothetical protein
MAQRTTVTAAGVKIEDVEAPLQDGGTGAVARLLALRETTPGDAIVETEIAGETWFLKRLDFAGTSLVGILLGREGVVYSKDGTLETLGTQNARPLNVLEAFTAVLLHVGVVCGRKKPQSQTPYFSLDVAKAFACDHAAKGLVAELFSALTELNPETLPLLQGALRTAPLSKPETASPSPSS